MNKKTYLIPVLCVVGVIFGVTIKQMFFKTGGVDPTDRDDYVAPIYRGPSDTPGSTFGGKNKKQKTKTKNKNKNKKINNKSRNK